jgi:hypothetical protein
VTKIERFSFVAELPPNAKTARYHDMLIVVAEGEPVQYLDLKNPTAGLRVLDSWHGSALGDLVVGSDQLDQQRPAEITSQSAENNESE